MLINKKKKNGMQTLLKAKKIRIAELKHRQIHKRAKTE